MYCRKELFDFLESNEGTVHLLDGSSYEIKGSEMISLQTYDGAIRKLDKIRYISSLRSNLILLSRLIGFNVATDGELMMEF